MRNTPASLFRRALGTLLVAATLAAGCTDGSPSLSTPTQPTPSAGPATPAPTPTPIRGAAPVLTKVVPIAGTTSGGTFMEITGTGLQPGATVTFGGEAGKANVHEGSMYLAAPAHFAGAVDVVVTNPDGQSARLVRAFTYVHPDTLDFNGAWSGRADGRSETLEDMRFIIQNNTVASFSCGGVTLTFSPRPAIANGEFSFSDGSGRSVSGKIVSAGIATGTVRLAACDPSWVATRP